MAIELFGFKFFDKNDGRTAQEEFNSVPALTPPQNEDGEFVVGAGGAFGHAVSFEAEFKNEDQLITRYRELALYPEPDSAIDDIVNEAISIDDTEKQVTINLDDVKVGAPVKRRIAEEFENILDLLRFDDKSYEIFRQWYVDGRIAYHKMVDINHPELGIVELRNIDPRKIKKVIQTTPVRDQRTGVETFGASSEYYVFSPRGFTDSSSNTGIKIATDAITYVTSGVRDPLNKMVLSHLHKAIKPINQLRALEDATVIYTLVRAPERRVFYIDVGNLPKMKAEQYLRDMMVKHKNKLVYDAASGEIRDDRKFMTMMEDFWLPRREGSRGTEISTLPGGQGLNSTENIDYFQKKVYRALNVPITRLDSQSTFSFGRATEVSRDEVKFAKFINRLRVRFSMLFTDILRTQCLLKQLMSPDEFDTIATSIKYSFANDNHFAEMRDSEIMQSRLAVLQQAEPYIGRFFSEKWAAKNILRLTSDEMGKMSKEIAAERPSEEETPTEQPTSPQDQNESPIEATVDPLVEEVEQFVNYQLGASK